MLLNDWRSIRSIKDLNEYQELFRTASASEKEGIIGDMVFEIEAYRQKEAQTELIMPPQAEKPLVRARRSRNGRASRRG